MFNLLRRRSEINSFHISPTSMAVLKLLLFTTVLSSFCTGKSTKTVYGADQQSSSYGCDCTHYACGCCAHLDVPRIGLNDTGCANFSYLPKEYGISFTLTIDNFTIYNETISARNPPPVCFGAPMLKEYADLCVRFYDLNVTSSKVHGCVELEARLHHVVVGTYKLGCFNLGQSNLKTGVLGNKPNAYKKYTFIPKNFAKLSARTAN